MKKAKQTDGEIALAFLNTVNPIKLEQALLADMGWGAENPTIATMNLLKELAKVWTR